MQRNKNFTGPSHDWQALASTVSRQQEFQIRAVSDQSKDHMNQRKPVTSAKLIVSALVAAYAAMFVATAGAAPADQAPPVVLFSDAKGGTYTYDVKSTRAGGHTISKRSVSVAEIGAIRADGFEVALQSEAADALVSVLPANISIIRRYGTYYGNIWTSGTRPTGTTTQWLTFDFSSYDYHGEHAPISLFLDASALAAPTPFIVGNGMIIGDVHGRTADDGGCGSS